MAQKPKIKPSVKPVIVEMMPAPRRSWVDRCAARLRELVQGEGSTLEELRAMASDMAQDPAYRDLEPEAAAEKRQGIRP